jgi:prefoldin subunit 5
VDPIRPRDVAAERSDLQQETAALEAELQRLRARIEELETSGLD